MVEETLNTVREAERKADEITKNADIECKKILSDARQQAADRQSEQVEAAKQAAKKALEEAGEKEAADMEEARNAIVGETEKIRRLALSRQPEAMQAVIQSLY